MEYAALFSGQGAFGPDMFRLVENDPAARPYLEKTLEFLSLSRDELSLRLSGKTLENHYAQPLICALEYAVWARLKDRLPPPRLFAGFSLGEFAAYGCAGSMDFQAFLELATARAAAMDKATPPGFRVIAVMGVPLAAIEKITKETGCHVMIVSGPDHATVGGDAEALIAARRGLEGVPGAEVRDVALSVPSHTPLLAAAAETFRETLFRSTFSAPEVPVLAGVDGSLCRTREKAVAALAGQIARTVRWDRCLDAAVERGVEVFLEIGPGSALTHIAQKRYPGLRANAVAAFHSLDGVADWILKVTA